jgi:LysM repeat protein
LAQQYKVCPICDTPAHRNATICSTCGAALTGVSIFAEDNQLDKGTQDYHHSYGETDLAEAALRWRGGTYLLGAVLFLVIAACAGILFTMGGQFNQGTTTTGILSVTPIPTQADGISMMTNTPRPTLNLPTVTPAPPTSSPSPTPTETPLPTPCMQEVQDGDDLFALVSRCGHQHYEAIIVEVVEINGLTDASRIQIGQILEIPWPTPTPDPNAIVTEEVTGDSILQDTIVVEENANPDEESVGLSPEPTETLQPGVAWHRVVKDENIIVIAVQYGVNVEILSQLNPEITFSQCDFSLDTGGANCIVQIFEGQLIRVPAPTPTPSLSPTPSGSETPTPTATPTFNAPSALSPGNRESFQADEFVTLRWVASGTLAPGQVYRVDVADQTTGSIFSANTQELFFIVPEGWQGQDGENHTYSWTVSVINTDDPNNPFYITEARTFVWRGRGEGGS